uniref:Uncharacterized protein n=1 Tax=Mus musculus TaxID=10090 RepID=Q8BT83_MOUSE|nr:unnamed protein product [Mus musculus]
MAASAALFSRLRTRLRVGARGLCTRLGRHLPALPSRSLKLPTVGAPRPRGHSTSQAPRVPAMPKKLRSGSPVCSELVGLSASSIFLETTLWMKMVPRFLMNSTAIQFWFSSCAGHTNTSKITDR